MRETPALGRFPLTVEIPVAWGDMDAFGHVNNVMYLRWCETARMAYFERIGVIEQMNTEGKGPILARASVDYLRPVTYPDVIRCSASINRFGNTSFEMAYRMLSAAQNAMVAEGESVVVMFDYRKGAKIPVGADLRTRIEALEGGA